MLTICRTLMGNPKLIMIDEPTEGLSPQMVENVESLIKQISKKGISILLVEQKLTIAFNLSNRLYVMGHGKIVYEGTAKEIRNNDAVIKEWLKFPKMSLLKGIKIIDLTRFVAGPHCALVLSDLGAEVIKIEKPNKGDDLRIIGPKVDNISLWAAVLNRGKKSLSLNLKSEEGRLIFLNF